MKIAIFSGAGVSRESGIHTFRDNDGIYTNEEIEKMVSVENFIKDPGPYYDWINERKEKYSDCVPNKAHYYFSVLEKKHEVKIITQNVDSLHEKAGSENVSHLHGEIDKMRYVLDHSRTPKLIDYPGPLSYHDSFTDEGQLRPHIVLFGEYPYNVNESYDFINEAEILIIVGTSLSIGYTHELIQCANKKGVRVIYLDPNPNPLVESYFKKAEFIEIRKNAVDGVDEIEKICRLITEHSN